MPHLSVNTVSTSTSRGRETRLTAAQDAPLVSLESRPASKREDSHFAVTLLIVALACFATLLCYQVFIRKYDSGLRRTVALQLKQLFPGTIPRIGRIVSDGTDSIVLSDVALIDAKSRDGREVFMAQRVVLHGDLDISHWAQQTTRVRQVDLHGAKLELWRQADGSWSVECLKPHLPTDSRNPPPAITIYQAILRLHQSMSPDAAVVELHDIEGQVTSEPSPLGAEKRPAMVAHLTGRSSGLVGALDLTGSFLPDSGFWHVTGSVERFRFSPTLIRQLPPQIGQYLSQVSGFECLASCHFEVNSSETAAPTFEVKGEISSGRLQDPRLPYPLESVAGSFHCKNTLLQLRSMHASSGGTQVDLHADVHGFSIRSPLVVRARVVDLELDSQLYRSLPPKLQEMWDRLNIGGRVGGDIQLLYDGLHWTPSAVLQCEDVSIQPWLFPYPLTKIHGPLKYQNGTVSSAQMQGQAGGQVILSSFSFTQQEQEWLGRLQVESQGTIAIDEQLLSALTPADKETSAGETFVRSLHPTGAVSLTQVAFERTSVADSTWHRTIDVSVFGMSINYDGFRYPIFDVRGRIFGQDNYWMLDRFEGRNDSGRILCSGNWQTPPDAPTLPFSLNFQAFAVPMVESLKHALPSDAQRVWEEFQPSGSVDTVLVSIDRPPGATEVSTHVTVEEDNTSNSDVGRSLNLLPRTLPYRLSDIECKIEYIADRVIIHKASGYNNASRISLQGECTPQQDGRWKADLDWLPQTRLMVDAQFLKALPRSVRDSLVRLDFSGPVSVFGKSQVIFSDEIDTLPVTVWDCQFDVENGRLADGRGIGNLRGTVWMQGSSDGTRLQGSGDVAMEALTVNGIPVSNLRGPFALVDSTLYFGSKVADVLPSESHAIAMTASALSGDLSLGGFGRLDTGKFYCEAQLRHAELAGLLQDVGVEQASTQARCDASLAFDGIPWNTQTWSGEGRVHLSDAQLFQLPFMIRFLRTASISANDDSAFQSADILFRIDGDRIPLQIACDGEVLRLFGDGWTNLRREVDLKLYSYVGRRVPISRVISPIMPDSRYSALMMFEVTGTLDNPQMLRRPFPQLTSIQEMFPEMATAD
ncbi:translocation/assembly module TamB domain-containing protein [Aureliella helgolandensis]|uniref:AsmA-like C-terminal domain-containing protein n=1 Tax=Aureliella helgolandensis TaxID=2527968 RepID=A0A518GEG4_9BACT|nr:hypothetical protein [Aureliella helgolandensis]QDV26989.1 hypothetical protein Q31a_53690 [Aureliella helgolandensis]